MFIPVLIIVKFKVGTIARTTASSIFVVPSSIIIEKFLTSLIHSADTVLQSCVWFTLKLRPMSLIPG